MHQTRRVPAVSPGWKPRGVQLIVPPGTLVTTTPGYFSFVYPRTWGVVYTKIAPGEKIPDTAGDDSDRRISDLREDCLRYPFIVILLAVVCEAVPPTIASRWMYRRACVLNTHDLPRHFWGAHRAKSAPGNRQFEPPHHERSMRP